jgi:hypothetical protein
MTQGMRSGLTARQLQEDMYIGPLVTFVAKDNANYQFAELPMNMNT